VKPFNTIDRDLQFAISVALFGLRMRESRFAKDIKWEELEVIAANSFDPKNYLQNEFFELLKHARKICSSRRRKKGDD
jgi:hypothetical protein